MSNQTTIQATLIPVVAEILAFPGDKLVIVNEVCVDVQPAHDNEATTYHSAKTLPVPKPRKPKVKMGYKDEVIGAEVIDSEVIEHLKEVTLRPLTVPEIAKAIRRDALAVSESGRHSSYSIIKEPASE